MVYGIRFTTSIAMIFTPRTPVQIALRALPAIRWFIHIPWNTPLIFLLSSERVYIDIHIPSLKSSALGES